jgi:hypothetical protein
VIVILLIILVIVGLGGLFASEMWSDYLSHKERIARITKETGHGDDA